MSNGGELAYQQLCGSITAEFNACSKQVSSIHLILSLSRKMAVSNFLCVQVIEMISLLSMPEFSRADLADLLKIVQSHEKEKLQLVSHPEHFVFSCEL
jgi:hypothetical protein